MSAGPRADYPSPAMRVRLPAGGGPLRPAGPRADSPGPAMRVRLPALLVLTAALAACGSAANRATRDPSLNLPSDNGIRAAVQKASDPAKTEFPSAAGKT